MRRRTFYVLAALLLIAGLSACDDGIVIDSGERVDGSGTIVTENRAVEDFDRITLAGEGAVVVSEGADASLSIETDDNLMTHIESTVSGGTLKIATESGIDIDPTDSVTYRVTTPHVAGLTLTGAGSFELGECDAEEFSIVLSGAGDIEIGRLVAQNLDVVISGAGSVRVAGQVTAQDVSLPGVGSYEGRELESVRATVTTSGAGLATVWVTDELAATVTGVGGIDYYGSPQVTQSVTGIGSITNRGDV